MNIKLNNNISINAINSLNVKDECGDVYLTLSCEKNEYKIKNVKNFIGNDWNRVSYIYPLGDDNFFRVLFEHYANDDEYGFKSRKCYSSYISNIQVHCAYLSFAKRGFENSPIYYTSLIGNDPAAFDVYVKGLLPSELTHKLDSIKNIDNDFFIFKLKKHYKRFCILQSLNGSNCKIQYTKIDIRSSL